MLYNPEAWPSRAKSPSHKGQLPGWATEFAVGDSFIGRLLERHSPTMLIAVVFDDHNEHAEDERKEDSDDGEDTAVVEAVGLCWVFGHERAL